MRAWAQPFALGFPLSLRELTGALLPVNLSFALASGPCSGSCQITLRREGFVHYTGHVHNSGALAMAYIARTSFAAGNLGAVVIEHRGHVGGTASFDTRASDWDETTLDDRISRNWGAVLEGARTPRNEFATATSALDLVDALVNIGTGTFVFGL